MFEANGPAATVPALSGLTPLPFGAIVVVGVGIEVLIIGADVGKPDLSRLERIVPEVSGLWVLALGRICAVPELIEVVITGTLAVTTDVISGPANTPPELAEVNGPASLCEFLASEVAGDFGWETTDVNFAPCTRYKR
jgi:hypothetical protein